MPHIKTKTSVRQLLHEMTQEPARLLDAHPRQTTTPSPPASVNDLQRSLLINEKKATAVIITSMVMILAPSFIWIFGAIPTWELFSILALTLAWNRFAFKKLNLKQSHIKKALKQEKIRNRSTTAPENCGAHSIE